MLLLQGCGAGGEPVIEHEFRLNPSVFKEILKITGSNIENSMFDNGNLWPNQIVLMDYYIFLCKNFLPNEYII